MKKSVVLALILLSMFSTRAAFSDPVPCDGLELITAKAAMDQANKALKQAIDGIANGDTKTTEALTNWLGVHNSTEAQSVQKLLTKAQYLGTNPKFLCDNSTYRNLGDVYAHVNPSDPFIVKLGYFFWSAADTGYDSKMGTLVHEMTHFNAIGATGDYAKDTTASKSLAASDPAKARKNANNYEYFIESIAFGLN